MTTTAGRRDGRETALVTGASRGIGYELAKLIAQDGYDLVVVSRNEQELSQLAEDLRRAFGTSVRVIAKDLSRPAAPQEIFDELRAGQTRIDVLVNNAGFGTHGPFVRSDLDSQLRMLQVNVTALTHLTGLFLPEMVGRGAGKIMNVASVAAFQPGPLMAVYYATKAYVLSFSEALSFELRGTGVTVTALCPGPTKSSFQERAGMKSVRIARGKMMDSASVARIGYRGLMKGKRLVIPGLGNKFLAQTNRVTPRKTVMQIVRWLNGTVDG